jgi:hypothetical protein
MFPFNLPQNVDCELVHLSHLDCIKVLFREQRREVWFIIRGDMCEAEDGSLRTPKELADWVIAQTLGAGSA